MKTFMSFVIALAITIGMSTSAFAQTDPMAAYYALMGIQAPTAVIPAATPQQSSGASAIANVTNQLAGMSYIDGKGDPNRPNGFLPQSPSQTLARNGGDCKDMATWFTDTLSGLGFNTERVAENYSSPSGSGGHTIGIATDGTHAWLETDQTVIMFNSIDAALANGGVSRLPAGATVSGQKVYGGTYVPGQEMRSATQ